MSFFIIFVLLLSSIFFEMYDIKNEDCNDVI